MPLSAGEKLGPYEILAPIGAGGMAEKAHLNSKYLGEIERGEKRLRFR